MLLGAAGEQPGQLGRGGRSAARLLGALGLAAALLGACQEDLALTTSGVQWLCTTDAHCGSGWVCGPGSVCMPAGGGADVSPDTTPDPPGRDCTAFCNGLDNLQECSDGTFEGDPPGDTTCQDYCRGLQDAQARSVR